MAYSCIHGTCEVARTGDLVACSCIQVTAVGNTYWRFSGVLLNTCHSLWVACIGDLMACSCIQVTRCGLHVLEN